MSEYAEAELRGKLKRNQRLAGVVAVYATYHDNSLSSVWDVILSEVLSDVRPYLRPALTEAQVDEALDEVVELGDDAKYGYFLVDIYDALRHLGLLAPKVTP